MALTSFHRMMDLPLEIRHQIYILATPGRVVHTRYPYPTPGIRIGRSSCSTLIPSLLHTFYESRSYLQRTGYRLAFQVTPTGRQFWFNFKRDTLFIDRGTLALMNQGINPFPLEDTQKIRRIAYERASIERYTQAVRLALQGFGELEEVFLVEWQSKVVDFDAPLRKSSESFLPSPIPRQHIYDTRNLCKPTEIQRIDEYLPLLHNKSCSKHALQNPLSVSSLKPIPQDTDLAKYLSEPYEKWRSLDFKREDLELDLAKYWAKLGRPKEKLPKFKPVHLLSDADHQHIRQVRRIGCGILQKRFLEKKRERSRWVKSVGTCYLQAKPNSFWPKAFCLRLEGAEIITPVHLMDEGQEEILQQKQKIAVEQLRQMREYWAPVLKERKERIDAGGGVISERELRYL